MISGKRYTCCILIFLFFHQMTTGQVALRASVDRNRILIGEPIRITIDAYFPLGVPVNWKTPDTIPHFEYLEMGRSDTVESIDGKKITQEFSITSFDSGKWELPSFRLMVNNKAYYSDTLMIDVGFTPFDRNADYRDIKEIEEINQASMEYLPWVIGIVTLLSIVVLVFLMRKKKSVSVIPIKEVPLLSPYDEAMRALEELKRRGWPVNGEVKNYYTRLNAILREFLFRKMNIRTAEKTNEELLREMQGMNFSRESFTQIADALRMSDFVKFAKYQPGVEQNQANYQIIESAIRIVNNFQ
ncbi:MAG TPA: BatD family protein [Flavitalea sp.]|nr:BatD family protein [Flavitalea sp.]